MAKKAAAPPVVDVTEDPTAIAVIEQGNPIQSFLVNARAFFVETKKIEDGALATLRVAQNLKLPTSANEDAAVQAFIQTANLAKKGAESHWAITSAVHAFHKKLTAKRNIATEALENAALIANRLHNTYADTEKRRAQAEEDRLRREAEARARQKQEAEAAELERVALEAEAASADLSDRERIFVDLMVEGCYATESARRAGYKNALETGQKLLRLGKITSAIQGKRDAAAARRQAEAVKAAPVEVEAVRVAPNVTKIGTDVTTWSGEVLDAQALVEAFRAGKHGIPADLLTVNQGKLTEYARALHELIDRWPGVRAKKTTGLR